MRVLPISSPLIPYLPQPFMALFPTAGQTGGRFGVLRVLSQHASKFRHQCSNYLAIHFQLYITVDGVMQKEIFLDHPASSWHARGPIAPPVLFWGHSTNRHIMGFQGRYRLGAVLLFTGEWQVDGFNFLGINPKYYL